MAEYMYYQSEKELIDHLMEDGYDILEIKDHLNGSSVQFVHSEKEDHKYIELGNANARKYVATILSLQLIRRKVT
ncbi:hypothetical protein ACI2JA_05430 [Alkalihalobacillus sp. NPDC078783]